jgi:mono/diheme cytochrome c family protein
MPAAAQPSLLIALVALVAAAAAPGQHDGVESAPSKPGGVDYLREVRPILAEHCYRCHGPDDGARQADLRLDLRAPAGLIARVSATDPQERMPLEGDPLSAAQIATLRRWVAEGAAYREHWSFVSPAPSEPPPVRNGSWTRGPIDQFVLRQLEDRGLAPAAEAPPETWLRRVTFDLTGLPPTPGEIDAFLANQGPRAREAVVDGLLASPRYGERQAQEWLDLARYADTNGYLYDEPRSIWKWRDWVIDAFNRNVPYDRFAVEQLAGDLLPGATVAQRVATGFNRNHPVNSEGGEADDEYRSAYVIDRANTTATAFLGLTLGCAQCHDHKFDPLTQKDFYRFAAFFNDVDENGRNSAVRPTISVPDAEQEPKLAALDARIEAASRELAADDAATERARREWEQRTRARLDPAIAWRVVEPSAMMAHRGSVLKQLPDGSIEAGGETPLRETFDLVLRPGRARVAAVRLEVLPAADGSGGGIGRGEGGRFIVTRLEMRVSTVSDATDPPLVWIARGECDLNQEQPAHPAQFQALPGGIEECLAAEEGATAAGAPRAPQSGWSIVGDEAGRPHEAILLPADALAINDASLLSVKIEQAGNPYRTSIRRFRISLTEDDRVRRVLLPVTAKFWSALGPFPADDVAKAWAADLPPEAGIAAGIDRARTYERAASSRRSRAAESKPAPEPEEIEFTAPQPRRGPRSDVFAWEEKRWRDGDRVPLAAGAWLLVREVESTAARTAVLKLAGADGVKVWVNGTEAFARAPRAAGPGSRPADAPESAEDGASATRPVREDDEVKIALREGRNEIVVKLALRGRGARGGAFGCELFPEGDDVVTHEVLAALAAGAAMTERQRAAVRAFHRERVDARGRALGAEITELKRERARLTRGMPATLVMKDRDVPREARVFVRGDFRNPGEKVEPAVPAVLPPLSRDLPRNRLGLARWLVDPGHPLTARVQVNRVWQQYFGEGLVRTPEDFGVRGDVPAQRELLDWMAARFVESGWDLKALHRSIALSAAYAMSASRPPELLERDPENRLLGRRSRSRLSAEMIRDQALFASGLLVERLGGPSVRPYQPAGLLQEVGGRRSAERRDAGPAQYRRGLYVYWKRALPYPSMTAFDAAKRDVCTARRSITTTPLQALVLLNDPVYVEAARMLGQRMIKEGGATDGARIGFGFRWCTSRAPSATEIQVLEDLLAAERRAFGADRAAAASLLGVGDAKHDPAIDPAELAAWAMVASALLNLDETVHRG